MQHARCSNTRGMLASRHTCQLRARSGPILACAYPADARDAVNDLCLRCVLQADAVLHFGTHGSLEFMPGKQVSKSGF